MVSINFLPSRGPGAGSVAQHTPHPRFFLTHKLIPETVDLPTLGIPHDTAAIQSHGKSTWAAS